LLTKAQHVKIIFSTDSRKYDLLLDVRFRNALKDDGNCKKTQMIINLPSGEAFMSPYEGEKGEKSKSSGFLPIEKEGNVRIYEIKENNIISCSDKKDVLMERINKDPAIGNIAEIAFGVLGLYGIKGCGEILLDEKLGMHIALGRDDHFGGITSPDKFKRKENVWHHDYVYTEEMQPKIKVLEAKTVDKTGNETIIIKEDRYVIF
jgi:leucyl aminopeptidase (aminopeptidase T)